MKACLQLNCNSVPEKINLLQLIQQNENLHKFMLENNEIEALRLLRDWEGSNIDSATIKTIGYLHLDVFIVI